MTEKLQSQTSQFEQTNQAISGLRPETQSRFNQFKSWLNKTQTKNMNQNLEIAATGQTPLRRAMAKLEGLITGDNTKSETLAQDLIDYRYEMAKLERKRAREAKGQTFQESVLEDINIKEAAKSQTKENTNQLAQVSQSQKTNSLVKRIKALAALALVSGGTLMAPDVLAGNNSKVENKDSVKVEHVKKETTKIESIAKTEYVSTKFKYSIPNVDASTIKAGTIVNEYRSNGVSFKGRFVMMPDGALFNLKGRSLKITKDKMYAIDADRKGYFELDNVKATKKVTPGMKISILGGKIVMVPDRPTQKNTESENVTLPKKEIPKPNTLPKKTTNQERIANPVAVKYLDPSTGDYLDGNITLKENVKKLERLNKVEKDYTAWSKMESGIYIQNKEYTAVFNPISKQIELYQYDPNKPESIVNLDPKSQMELPILLKVLYRNRVAYMRFHDNVKGEINISGRTVISNLNKSGSSYFLGVMVGYDMPFDKTTFENGINDYKSTLIRDQNGNIILKD